MYRIFKILKESIQPGGVLEHNLFLPEYQNKAKG